MLRRPLTRAVPAVVFAALCLLLLYSFSPRTPRYRYRGAYREPGFDWRHFKQKYAVPAADMARLPRGPPGRLGRVQHDFRGPRRGKDAAKQAERRGAVVAAFAKSWDAYRRRAWMWDELAPVSGGHKNTLGGLGATLVDALDTLWIMGLKAEFAEAVGAVAELDFMSTRDASLNLFETTIRYLGGLLAAYDLSGEPVLLRKAVDLGDMLYVAFDTPNRLPGFWFDFERARDGVQTAGTADASAAPTSLALEFTRLAQLTGDDRYYDAVDRVARFLRRTQNETALPGMWPRQINFRDEAPAGAEFTLGAQADSLYEYLPKMAALLGGREPLYEALYRAAADAAERHLLFRPMTPDGADVLFAGEGFALSDGNVTLRAEGQHLSCFAGGMFALAGRLFGIDRHVDVGGKLARGCSWGYRQFPTGILPEIFGLVACEDGDDDDCAWDEDLWFDQAKSAGQAMPMGFTHARDARYILRPEAIESVFLLYRITGDASLQDVAWDMFEAIRNATETEYAFAAISDVNAKGEVTQIDSMEVSSPPPGPQLTETVLTRRQSFWLAETLKYFYLVFSPPDVISLDEYVFNTEAHPLKRP